MNKRLISLIFAGILLLLCLVPPVGMLIAGPAEAGANEVLAFAPGLKTRDGTLNTAFLSDCADYLADRFFPRQEAITAWNALNAALGASGSPSVVLGRDGWLYYADTLPDYAGSAPKTDRALWCAARTLLLMQEYAGEQGSDFVFFIAPNKNSLYPEHMPASVPVRSGESDAARLSALLNEMGVNNLDLRALLAAESDTLYFKTDSHWTTRGAALGADGLLNALGRESGFYTAGFSVPGSHTGDLYSMLYPAGTETEDDPQPDTPFTFTYVRPIRGVDDIRIETVCENAGGELLMFRDSFGNSLYPFLAESFGKAAFSRLTSYDLTMLNPGAALCVELVERNLGYLNTYAPVLPAPERKLTGLISRVEATPFATVEKSSLDGCVKLTGTLPLPADTDSPVYLCAADGRLYEAFPSPDGFAAHIPAGLLNALTLVYSSDGRLIETGLIRCENTISD